MSVFRRRGTTPDETHVGSTGSETPGAANPDAAPQPEALNGPFDVSQLPSDDDHRRIDFGSLVVPAVDGMQVRLEMDEHENVVAVSVMLDDTALQMQTFAAPRHEGLWEEIRQELAEGIRASRGKAREADGPFGRELRAEVAVTGPEGTTAPQPVRFIGVDGPRWFLRGLISGVGGGDADRAKAVERVFAAVAVRRGSHAAPPREPLPLALPDDAPLATRPPQQS